MFGFVRSNEVKALRSEVVSLKGELKAKESTINHYIEKLKSSSFAAAANEEKHRKEVEDLKLQIENLEQERDILRKYYDLDSEPTPDMKAEMRLYDRIHALEMENMELRGQVNNLTNCVNTRIINNLQCDLAARSMWVNRPFFIENGVYKRW